MKTVTIGTILEQLPTPARTKVETLLQQPDVLDRTDELRQLLEPHHKALRRLGLVPGYAAYAMAHYTAQARTEQSRADAGAALDFLTRN